MPDDAVETLLRQAVDRAPGERSHRLALAAHLHRRGRPEQVLELLSADAQCADASSLCGQAALALGRLDEAKAWLVQADARGAPGALSHLIRVVAALQDDAASVELCRRALKRSPEDHFALGEEARRMLGRGHADHLDALCTELRARGARNAFIGALQAVARARMGDEEMASSLTGQRLLKTMPGPHGIDLARLADEILQHENLQPPVAPEATRGGLRVDRPLIASAPVLRRLVAGLTPRIETYVAGLGELGAELARAPVRLRVWAVVMQGASEQTWHLHPCAVVSGVYYVSAPSMGEDDDEAGALRFGLMPFEPAFDDAAYRQVVRPEPGRLVLFPSTAAHCVAPTGAPAPRISVAFDVVRA